MILLLLLILLLIILVNSDITSTLPQIDSFPFDTHNNNFKHDCPENSTVYCIFKPIITYHDQLMLEPKLLHKPESWFSNIKIRVNSINKLLINPVADVIQEARAAYLQVLSSYVTGMIYGNAEKAVDAGLQVSKHKLNPMQVVNRESGYDWSYLGVTMTGKKRVETIERLLKDVFQKNVGGDIIETGVWRGGSSIFARGVVRVYDQGQRLSFVCDSFAGLPPGKIIFGQGDMNWDSSPYLEVNSLEVAKNFHSVSLLDPNVVFVQGFFNNSMPHLRKQVGKIALLRLDGDIYESTVDILYHLYDKVEIGGYIIIDDWSKDDLNPPTPFPAKLAVLDFFKVHNMSVEIVPIDIISVYWQKKEDVEIQYWRYEKNQYNKKL